MLANKAEFEKKDLEIIFGGEHLNKIDENWRCKGVSIDSRTIEGGNLFVALIGSTIDGHDKAREALARGAAACIVQSGWYGRNIDGCGQLPMIIVENTDIALGKLAKFHRRRYNYPVIAIAGSNGKTTTKDMIAAVLSKKFRTLSTYANFNNQLGLPLMLLQLSADYDCAALEIGTNEPGEISILSEMAAQTDGIITNIGKEHLEKLIDLDGVEMEETSLFGYLHKHGGRCFVNLDDPRLARYARLLDNKITYGASPEAAVSADISLDVDLHPLIKLKMENDFLEIKLSTFGFVSGLNGIAAMAAGLGFGLSPLEIKDALENFRSDSSREYGRMLLEKPGGYMLVNDCYNANPSSTLAALNTISKSTAKKKIAVLGDMLELGETAAAEHLEILRQASVSMDIVYVAGAEMRKASEAASAGNIKYFEHKEEIAPALKSVLTKEDIVLVKGSRRMKMEDIINSLKKLLS